MIIVGGGTALLMAVWELGLAGRKVLLLEAKNRLGGRIHSVFRIKLFPPRPHLEARKTITKGIDKTIFFAGEGLYDGIDSGTVEAALVSGRETARRVIAD